MAHNEESLAHSGAQQAKVTYAFLVLAWIFIMLRLWTRTFVISTLGWDDFTMVLAAMLFTVYCAGLLFIEANGGGTHVTGLEHLQLLTKWVVVSEATYVLAMMVIKISLGIFFARIIARPWHFVLVYVNVGANVLSSLLAFFYSLFRCGPNINKYILQTLSAKCMPRTVDRFVAYQQAAFTTSTDLVFVAIPILILWNANMDKRAKLSVGFVLCLAMLGCICSVIRFRYVDGLTQIEDFFWSAVNIGIWSTIEAGVCIVAGCLATLRPLMKPVVSTVRASSALSGRLMSSRPLKSLSRSDSRASPFPRTRTATPMPTARVGMVQRSPGATTRGLTHIRSASTPTLTSSHASSSPSSPSLLEFIAPHNEPAHPAFLSSLQGSTERILSYTSPIAFPWPSYTHTHPNTTHTPQRPSRSWRASWTLRRNRDIEDRMTRRPRPLSMPVLPLASEERLQREERSEKKEEV